MSLTADWPSLQAAITEYSDAPGKPGHNVVVLSLPIAGGGPEASTAVASSLLRGLVNEYFESYETPVEAQFVSITKTGILMEPDAYSLAVFLRACSPGAFINYADAIHTAVEQALEDLEKTLARPDADTNAIIQALKHARRLEDDEPPQIWALKKMG